MTDLVCHLAQVFLFRNIEHKCFRELLIVLRALISLIVLIVLQKPPGDLQKPPEPPEALGCLQRAPDAPRRLLGSSRGIQSSLRGLQKLQKDSESLTDE